MAPPGSGGQNDAGTRVRDMLAILKQKAPKLLPNIIPKVFKQTDLLSICSTPEQKEAVRAVLEEQCKDEDARLVVISSVDLDAGVLRLTSAKFVNEAEADVYSVDRVLDLFLQGESDELTVRMQYFLSANGHDESDVSLAQEVYNLAYALSVCLSAAPLRLTVGNTPTPLDASIDARALVASLFNVDGPAKGNGKKRRKEEEAGGQKQKQKGGKK